MQENNQSKIGEKIRSFRKRAGMSQLDLEVAIDASNGSISRIESGEVNPTKETLLKIANELKLVTFESAVLFGLNISDLAEIVNTSAKVSSSLDLNISLQTAATELAQQMNFTGIAISLVVGDKAFLRAITETSYTHAMIKLFASGLENVSVSLTENTDNLTVKTILEKKPQVVTRLEDISIPAVNETASKIIERLIDFKSGISIPLLDKGTCIGAAFFSRNYATDYSSELNILSSFAEVIVNAINNSVKFKLLLDQYNN